MKKNIYYKYIVIFLYLLIFILCGLNHGNPDYHMYQLEYMEYGVNAGFEPVFSFLMDIFHFLGFSYSFFVIIITIIILVINYFKEKNIPINKFSLYSV